MPNAPQPFSLFEYLSLGLSLYITGRLTTLSFLEVNAKCIHTNDESSACRAILAVLLSPFRGKHGHPDLYKHVVYTAIKSHNARLSARQLQYAKHPDIRICFLSTLRLI